MPHQEMAVFLQKLIGSFALAAALLANGKCAAGPVASLPKALLRPLPGRTGSEGTGAFVTGSNSVGLATAK